MPSHPRRPDVTAVLLTMGEPGTERALASISRQTVGVADVVVVRGVSPFSTALNLAARKVRTPYFIQVDSDMVLDPGCVERLREAMLPHVGIAAGLLRDPLMGEIGAIKLFRRECFDAVQLRDTISTDVDFYRELADLGWSTIYVLPDAQTAGRRTVAEHRPEYTPAYTYSTYYLLGARYWRRRDPTTMQWRFRSLRASKHGVAGLARVALAHGVFSDEERDVAKASVTLDGEVLAGLARYASGRAGEVLGGGGTSKEFYERGRELGARRAYTELGGWLRGLATGAGGSDPWPLEVALSHGFLSAVEGTARPSERVAERLGELAGGAGVARWYPRPRP